MLLRVMDAYECYHTVAEQCRLICWPVTLLSYTGREWAAPAARV